MSRFVMLGNEPSPANTRSNSSQKPLGVVDSSKRLFRVANVDRRKDQGQVDDAHKNEPQREHRHQITANLRLVEPIVEQVLEQR